MKKTVAIMAALAAVTLVVSGCAAGAEDTSSTETTVTDTAPTETASTASVLASVQEAGVVRCGTRDALPGFAVLQEDGTQRGLRL